MFNDIHGRENHLVKLDKLPSYTPPKKCDPREVVEKKKEKKRAAAPKENKEKKKRKISNN